MILLSSTKWLIASMAVLPSTLLSGLLLSGCASDDSQPSNAASAGNSSNQFAEFAACSNVVLEQDIGHDTALVGPGVDQKSGQIAPGSYFIATTYLALKPDQIDVALELGQPIVESLASMHGFVAFSLTQSATCASLRTLTVWQTEEDMMAFVVSPAHLKAMPRISSLSRGTSNTVAWQASETDATWSQAIAHLRQGTTEDL
jgi:heme-degrading monooxygenase HmoA